MSVRLLWEAQPAALLRMAMEMTFPMQTGMVWLQGWSFKSSNTAAELYGNAVQDKRSPQSQYVRKLNTSELTNGVNAPYSNKCYIDIMRISCVERFNGFCTFKNS